MKRIGTLFGIICTVLLTVHLSFGQTAKNLTQLGTQNDVIRNETTPGANTRGRIADMYKSIFLSSPNIFESYTNPSWLTLTFPGISGKPTTIGGYGITDFNSLGDARWLQSSTLGTGVSTWLTTPSWTNFNSAITGTAPFIKTGGTSLLTSNVNMSRVTLFNSGNERDSSMLRINKSSLLLKHYWRDVNATGIGDRQAFISIRKIDSTIWSSQGMYEIKVNNTFPAFGLNMGMTITPFQMRLGTNGGAGAGLVLNADSPGLQNSLVSPGTAAGFYSGAAEAYLANASSSKIMGFDATGIYINLNSNGLGDTYYHNASGYFTRLVIGSAGQVMTVSGGLPSWATPSGGGTVTNVSSANANATVATQTTTPVITIVNSPAVGGITITGTPSVGQIPTATSGTAATWQTPASGFADPMTTRGDLIFRNASNVTARLGRGTATQVLTSDGTDLSWATPSGGGGWATTGATALTGAVDIQGTTTNTIKYSFPSLGTTLTDGAGLWLQNTTAAASGLQQISPMLTLEGRGWKTNATAASQPVKTSTYVLPVQGGANPNLEHVIAGSINGAAYGNMARFVYDGTPGSTNFFTGLLEIRNTNSTATTLFNGSRYLDFTTGSGPTGATWQSNFTAPLGGISTAGGIARFLGTFTRSSGTNAAQFIKIQPTINTTSTYAGIGIALDIDPVLTSTTGYTNLSLRTTSGQTLLNGTTVTASTTLDVRGISGGSIHRLATNADVERFDFLNDGSLQIGGNVGTVGQVVTSAGAGGLVTWTTPEILTAKVTVSSAEILALNSVNKTLIAAPGAGKVIEVIGLSFKYNYLTAAYATHTTLNLLYNTTSVATFSGIIDQTSNKLKLTSGVDLAVVDTSTLESHALSLSIASGVPTGGGGSLDVYITYRIITL